MLVTWNKLVQSCENSCCCPLIVDGTRVRIQRQGNHPATDIATDRGRVDESLRCHYRSDANLFG